MWCSVNYSIRTKCWNSEVHLKAAPAHTNQMMPIGSVVVEKQDHYHSKALGRH